VKSAVPAAPAAPASDQLTAELGKRDAAIAQLSSQLDAMRTTHEAALKTRDKQLADLSGKVNALIKTPPTK